MKVIDFQNASCKHCYKCVRNCSVKAISVRHEQAHIMNDHCIHCGKCLEVCPQNAKRFASDLELIKAYIRQNMKIVVSIAPSYLGVMNYRTPGQVVGALRKLGFDEVRETSEGAAFVTREYQKLLREGTYKNIITTCCPSVNELVEKYYPELTDQLAPVVSPMIAHGRLIKKMYGEQTKVVFLGPCIAKKQEAMGDSRVFGAVDAILTFEELEQWLEEEQIVLEECEDLPMANPDCGVNRLYPVSGGVLQSVMLDSSEMREKEQGEEKKQYHKVYVDGLDNCMEMLESLKRGDWSTVLSKRMSAMVAVSRDRHLENGMCRLSRQKWRWSGEWLPIRRHNMSHSLWKSNFPDNLRRIRQKSSFRPRRNFLQF